MMESQANSDYELLTEHLGYPPVSLLDDIINTVNVLADRALDSVERLLLSIPPQSLGFTASKSASKSQPQPPPEEAAKLEIETGTHKLETLVTASIDRNFDKLELYTMQNILTVQPRDLHPYMRLAHYAGLEFPATDRAAQDPAAVDDRPTLDSVTALRRRVQASQKLNVELQRQRDRNEALLRNLREVLGIGPDGVKKEEETAEGAQSTSTFGFLGRGRTVLSSIGSKTPVTTTTQFTLSQLQSLRALSLSLRTLLPELEAAKAVAAAAAAEGTEPASGKRSWRRERAGYVEAASRKYLENTGGLELGSQGEVRDGEYQGQGRNLDKADVEGLEKAVGILRNSEGRSSTVDGGDEPRDPS